VHKTQIIVEKIFQPIVGPKLSVVVSFGFFFGGVTCACRRRLGGRSYIAESQDLWFFTAIYAREQLHMV
jgi:hypothetical protein